MRPVKAGDLLFVYGSLLSGFSMRERLGLDGLMTLLGPAAIRGALYDLGPYPAFRPGPHRVRGELHRIDAAAAGPRLDDYEDCDPTAPERSIYVRKRRRLKTPAVWAWVYVYGQPVDARRRIACGDWRAFASRL